MNDPVNKPLHYNMGAIGCIEAIEASMSKEEFLGYLKGSAMKYLWRYQHKGRPVEDLEKCMWFLQLLKEKIAENDDVYRA